MYNLLLVDDEPIILESLHDILARHFDFHVTAFEYSADAMQLLRAGKTDILVTDIKMPDYNGFELAEEAHRTNPHTRVVFITGYADFDYAYSAIKSRCDDYILKFNIESEIVDSFRKLLSLMGGETATAPATGDIDVLQLVKEYIKDHITEDLSLSKLADRVFYSPSYLSKIFKQSNGVTLSEFITETRIDKSKELLLETRHKVYEIAKQVGFESPIYYNRVFIKKTGVTPKKYRKMNASNQ